MGGVPQHLWPRRICNRVAQPGGHSRGVQRRSWSRPVPGARTTERTAGLAPARPGGAGAAYRADCMRGQLGIAPPRRDAVGQV